MSDPRFARLKSDPRFRRPRKKTSKISVDDRFKQVFNHQETRPSGGHVDKYGRKISHTQEQDNLKRFYRLESEDDAVPTEQPPPITDFARGEVLLESSDEEESDTVSVDSSSAAGGVVILGSHDHASSTRDVEHEINLDEDNFADLDAQAAAYSKNHPDTSEVGGSQTRRLAVVNLDWDHVRASHLFKIASSLVTPTTAVAVSSSSVDSDRRQGSNNNVTRGMVLSVRIYVSEFGKERLAREETEGPPPEIFKKRDILDNEEINEQNIYDVGGEDDYDEDALRRYQLERLRYYYAVITCDTVHTASHIYSELEGTELERSANVFDLSFIPDDMIFDSECRDEATNDLNVSYKSVNFVTDALRHSKVKLTWDEDDPERNHITRRTLSKKEIEDADFKAYLASSSSEAESDTETQLKPKTVALRDNLRALLLGGGNDLPEGWDRHDGYPHTDMEITFTPGLSQLNAPQEETTLDKYQRKMKEKRKKRKEDVKEKDANMNKSDTVDEFFDDGNASDDAAATEGSSRKDGKVLGRKVKLRKQRQDTLLETHSRPLTTPEELSLLIASDNPNVEPKHFDLKSVLKAEKKSKRKWQRGKRNEKDVDNEAQEDFSIDVSDDRFKVLHEDHNYAIDPSNPHFKKTKSMAALIEERSKRQNELRDETPHGVVKRTSDVAEDNLKSLVESVKRKSVDAKSSKSGKRRKL